MVCGVAAVHRRLAGERRVQARARGARCRRRSATPTCRADARADHPDRARQGSRSAATRAPTTCAPTSCASGGAGRSPRRRSRADRHRRADHRGRPTPASAPYAAATVASPRVAGRGRRSTCTRAPRRRAPSRDLHDPHAARASPRVVGAILFAAVKLGNNQETVSVPNVVDKTEVAAPARPRSAPPRPVDQARARARSRSTPSIDQIPEVGQREARQHGDDHA